MLKIVNNSGDEMMRIEDDGKEVIKDSKLKEQMQKAEKEQKDGE
jgi:hypothetical protein